MIKFITRNIVFLFLVSLSLYSCKSYKSIRMFETDVEYINDSIQDLITQKDHTLKIAANDFLTVNVYTAKGEILIDPDQHLNRVTNSENSGTSVQAAPLKYYVRADGYVSLPMVGDVFLLGYTTHQADSILQTQYNQYYAECFVYTKLVNKRVVVLGPNGGKVIPIENQNMSIIEVIALYETMRTDGKMDRIRVIRGDLKNPHVQIIDLQTVKGMMEANLAVLPGDIIYIEPQRKIVSEAVQDYIPILSALTSLLTLAVLLGIVKIN